MPTIEPDPKEAKKKAREVLNCVAGSLAAGGHHTAAAAMEFVILDTVAGLLVSETQQAGVISDLLKRIEALEAKPAQTEADKAYEQSEAAQRKENA